jgi:hypothetical protein
MVSMVRAPKVYYLDEPPRCGPIKVTPEVRKCVMYFWAFIMMSVALVSTGPPLVTTRSL